jgi:tetratricopeptide (TPR) repeat protein
MIRRVNGRHRWLLVCASVAALSLAVPAAAQTTGMVKGTVKDDKGQPVVGAKIVIEFTDGVNRRQETKTDKKGEFVQIGLQSGNYKVTAEKEGVGSQSFDTRVRIGQAAEVNFVLAPGKGAGPTKEDAAKAAELKKTFEEGVTASKAGNADEAIAKFTRGTEISPTCADCYYNIGFAYSQKKDYAKAEAAYKKALEVKPQYSEAYNGLANVYNAQRKFEEAAAASAKASEFGGGGAAMAGGGGNANALYNQGVILWNAGKIPEAKKQFEAAIQADPNHAESHYQLGMAMVNEGTLAPAVAEFETYLKLAPDGPNAAMAKSLLGQLKK